MGNTYLNYEFQLSRENWLRNQFNAVSGIFSIKKIAPDYNVFKGMIEQVGGPWGWTKRPKYLDEKGTRERLTKGSLWLLRKGKETAGYCFATPWEDGIVEIENFGLFPEHNGKGYGGPLLKLVFAELMKDYDNVILYSRSTNHKKVPEFYIDQGMTMTNVSVEPDDLVPGTPGQYSKEFPDSELRHG